MNSQSKEKKMYQKPSLAKVSVFEASGKTCCKTTNGTCSAAARSSNGKGSRTSSRS